MKPFVLDVRCIPHASGEPFATIMAAVNGLGPDQPLLLTAPFKPEPLLKLLHGKGFDSQVTSDVDGIWQVLFTPSGLAEPHIVPSNPLTWPRPARLEDLCDAIPGRVTDAVLALLKGLKAREVLFALLKDEPTDLPFRLLDDGHLCFGRWQEGTYRVMVLVAGAEGHDD